MYNYINVTPLTFNIAFKAIPDFIVFNAPIGSVNVAYSGGLINGGAPVNSAALPALLAGLVTDLLKSGAPGKAAAFTPAYFNGLTPADFNFSGLVTKPNAPAGGTLNVTVDSATLLEITNYFYYNSYGDYID